MKGKISLLTLEAQSLQTEARAEYEKLFSKYSDSELSFEAFSDLRALFVALSQAIPESETLVLAIPDSQYLTIKKLLFSALKTQTETNAEILEQLHKNGVTDSDDYAVMPKSAQILLSQSGKNSGFIEGQGSQTLFFLPMNDEIAAQIQPQLCTFLGIVEPVAAVIDNESDMEIQSSFDAPSSEHDLPYKVVKLLREKGITAAVAPSKCSPLVFEALTDFENAEDYNDVIYPFDIKIDKKDLSQNDYTAALAGHVRKESNASLGISLSSVFMSQEKSNEYFMILCVADEANARVVKMYSCEGESLEDFIHACIQRLYEMLGDYADNFGFIAQVPADHGTIALEPTDIYSNSKPTHKKTGIIIALAVVAALLLGLAVTFFVKAYNANPDEPSSSPETTESRNILSAFKASIIDSIEKTNDEITDALSSTDALDSTEDISSTESDSTQSTSEISDILSLTDVSSMLTAAATTSVITTRPAATTRPATTVPPTTTKEHTTQAPTTTKPASKSGTFTFTVYGYGHGVGMSQNGAMAYAKNGWDYKKILLHYYNASGMSIVKDTNMPDTVSFNGKSYSLVEYLAKTTRAEMGASAHAEALKAQIVAIYTYAKRSGYKMTSSHHAFNSSYDYEGTAIHSAVNAVLGEYLAYNGSPAFTPYFATSAGKTTSSANTWGGSYAYLQGGRTSIEGNVVRTLKMSSEELKECVNAYNAKVSDSNKITLQDDPAKWITVLSHDSAVNKNVGYISSLRIGNQTMRGNAFRLNIMGAATLRSHCFSYTYTPD